MFWTIYSSRIRRSVRAREMLIWTWIFPILLSTLFYFAFSNLDADMQFSPAKAAVIQNTTYTQQTPFRQTLESVSEAGDDQLIDLTVVATVQQADELLKKGEIAGYITPGATPKLTVKENGFDQSVLKSFLDTYQQQASAILHILETDPGALREGVLQNAGNGAYTQSVNLAGSQSVESIPYYFALMALISLYGGFQGLETVSHLQANLSPLGARQSVAPVKKFKMILYDSLGGLTVHFASMLVVLLYITLLLGKNFSRNLLYFIPICLLGGLVGFAMGAMVSAMNKRSDKFKSGLIVTVSLICSFLAGLMVQGINYTVASSAPVVAWINPAARIADAFYRIYFYGASPMFFLDLTVLAAMAFAFFGVAALFLRRQKYESI